MLEDPGSGYIQRLLGFFKALVPSQPVGTWPRIQANVGGWPYNLTPSNQWCTLHTSFTSVFSVLEFVSKEA